MANKTNAGMAENTAGALAYLFWILGGVYFLVTDKRPSVKFHAGQSITLSLVYALLRVILPWGMQDAVGGFIGLVTLVVWAMAMYKAYQGQKFRIPLIADISENIFK